MKSIIELTIAALLPAVTAVVFFCLERAGRLQKIPPKLKSVMYGLIFGIYAVLGTEFGVSLNNAQINCRDAAVLIAGLFFGGPAGIIAGLIGGIERWFSVYWGVASYTRVACSVSTIFAGVFSALISRFMLEGKKPLCGTAVFVGLTMEVFHLSMVFLTNMRGAAQAIEVIRSCTLPMLTANGGSVFLAALLVSFAGQGKKLFRFRKRSEIPIFEILQRGLLIVIAVCVVASNFFIYRLEENLSRNETGILLKGAVTDAANELQQLTGVDLILQTHRLARNRHVDANGVVIITDPEGTVLSASSGFDTDPLAGWLCEENTANDGMQEAEVSGVDYYYRTAAVQNYIIWAIYPEDDAHIQRDISVYMTFFLVMLAFMCVYVLLYLTIKKIIGNQVVEVADSLSSISAGHLNESVNVRDSEEFASLSDNINHTVDTLRHYIAEAAARIDEELENAAKIQLSALPSPDRAFPNRKDFEIYAKMDPAKEVGGDFYDFYMTGHFTLNILIADVSGKGIPASLFMMRAKSTLKDLTESGLPVNQVFMEANNHLCDGNDAEMFVTAWQGRVHLDTGLVEYSNAGHNAPLVRHGDGPFAYLPQKRGFVLAGMEDMVYKMNTFQLSPGDVVLIYTDGVTEATSAQQELYGDDRLLNIVNTGSFATMKELLTVVRQDIDAFVGEAPQFDDLTMLALRYNGPMQEPETAASSAKNG